MEMTDANLSSLSGLLFTTAEREFNGALAALLRAAGRETLEAVLAGMDATQPMEDSPGSATRGIAGLRLVGEADPQDNAPHRRAGRIRGTIERIDDSTYVVKARWGRPAMGVPDALA